MSRYSCPCCGFLTMTSETRDSYDICPVCFWEDDPVQFENPDWEGGANRPSLRQAQHTYKTTGVFDPSWINFVRPPTDAEKPK